MKKLYRGPYIDVFCQVWFHLAQLFQRSRLKYEKVNGRTTDAKWWQYLTWPFGSGELKTGQWLQPFLCLNCFTNTFKYYRKNYSTVSVKHKTDLKLFCYNHPGCVCSVIYRRFIQQNTLGKPLKRSWIISDYVIQC